MEEEKKEQIENNGAEQKDLIVRSTANKWIWLTCTLIVGIIIGLTAMFFIKDGSIKFNSPKLKDGEQAIAKVNKKEISVDDLYSNMKANYPIEYILDDIDRMILEDIYKLDDDMKEDIEEQAKYYLDMYKNYYGYTEEEFLEGNGFENYDDFIDTLSLDYMRSLCYSNYIEKLLPEGEVKKYYEENVYGDIDSKHMLVTVTEEVNAEQALALAKEIITKRDGGADFDTLAEEYGEKVTFEELGYQGFNSSIEEPYMTALKSMENGTYTKEPVETSYGYHVIYRIDQKQKPELKNAKINITKILGADIEAEDPNAQYKALIEIRKESKLKFYDEELQKKYDEYCKKYTEEKE